MTFTVQILTLKCPSSTDGRAWHRHILCSELLASASLPRAAAMEDPVLQPAVRSSKGCNTLQLPRGFTKERQTGAYHD